MKAIITILTVLAVSIFSHAEWEPNPYGDGFYDGLLNRTVAAGVDNINFNVEEGYYTVEEAASYIIEYVQGHIDGTNEMARREAGPESLFRGGSGVGGSGVGGGSQGSGGIGGGGDNGAIGGGGDCFLSITCDDGISFGAP
ncbi:MAG: hypothetical protein AB8E15_02335 [Bdellovibrionales bacterium]